MTIGIFRSTILSTPVDARGWSSWKTSSIFLFGLFMLEAAIFYWTVIKYVAPFYPTGADQISYYINAYEIIANGWQAVWQELTNGQHANGVLFAAQGAALGLLFGANRAVIIGLNLIYFLALQLILFRVVAVRTRSLELAWVAVALTISCQTVLNVAGGIYDFRIDFVALCLYGIWIAAIIWSDVFRYTVRSLWIAAAVSLLISTRFITAVYVVILFGSLVVLLAFLLLVHLGARDISFTRLRNLLAVCFITLIVVAPLLFRSREAIYNYYFIGHVFGEEKYIRAHVLGLYTLFDHVAFYPLSILHDHLRLPTLALMAVVTFGSVIFAAARLVVPGFLYRRVGRYGLDLFVCAIAVIAPILVLTADISKSTVVGGIVVVPIVLLVTLLCAVFWPGELMEGTDQNTASTISRGASATSPNYDKIVSYFRQGLVVIVSLIGFGCFAARGLAAPDNRPPLELEKITTINDTIAHYLIANRVVQPRISFDRVCDYVNWGTVVLFGFERFHRLIDLQPRFGHGDYGILATPRDLAMQLFMESDVIILSDPVQGRGRLPLDETIPDYWDDVASWTKANRPLYYSTMIFGVPYKVYVRPVGASSIPAN